jgi:small conductance mechanosensitive channel
VVKSLSKPIEKERIMNWTAFAQMVQERATTAGLQILGALVLYIVGRTLISLVASGVQRALSRQKIEPTVLRFIGNAISVALNVTLVVAILGYFGVQTTTFAALIAASALAVGTAWAGLLANFAAGAFLLVLRPFKVGDFISAAGITGTVHEIGLFVTSFDTPDNVRTFVGNNKIFSDTIQNFTANPYRRVELTAQISGAADPSLAIARLTQRVAAVANVCETPAPDVTILTFNPFGPVLAVRPYCHNDHYWQVYFDTNMAIREVLGDAAFPGPAYPLAVGDTRSGIARAVGQA